LVHFGEALDHDLAHRSDHLAPAEALLDALSLALADFVARVSGGACVDGAAAVALGVLRHMRRDVEVSAGFDEAFGVVGFFRAERHPLARARDVAQHLYGHVALGRSIGGAGLHVDHQAMAVVRQHAAQVAGQRRRSIALAVQARLGVAFGLVRGVAAGLTVPVFGWSAGTKLSSLTVVNKLSL
jgi:hypothetical protein